MQRLSVAWFDSGRRPPGGKNGLTQEDVADLAQIHRTYVSDIERGARNVSLINVERLASALKTSLSALFAEVERL